MDVSRLTDLGKVAGLPGIAVGAAVLIIGGVLALTGTLPESWRGPLLIIVVVGALGLGVLAMIGWMGDRKTRPPVQFAEAAGADSVARNEASGPTGGRQTAIATGKGGTAVNEIK